MGRWTTRYKTENGKTTVVGDEVQPAKKTRTKETALSENAEENAANYAEKQGENQ